MITKVFCFFFLSMEAHCIHCTKAKVYFVCDKIEKYKNTQRVKYINVAVPVNIFKVDNKMSETIFFCILLSPPVKL